jgi:hypothetical protein
MRPAPHKRRPGVLVVFGALAAMVVACSLTLGHGSGTGGTEPTTTWSTPEIPATTLLGTPPQPTPLIAVGEDGSLVTVDAATGQRTGVLATGESTAEIAGVTLSADRSTVWFDVCCEQAWAIHEVPLDGSSAPEQIASGSWPEASPTGTRLAYLAGDDVVVRNLVTDQEQRWATVGGAPSALAWVGDGTDLVWVQGGRRLAHLDVDAAGARPQVVPGAAVHAGEVLFAPLRTPSGVATVMAGDGPDDPTADRIVVAQDLTATRQPDPLGGGARDRAWDATQQWGLRTDADGSLRWSVGGGTGLIAGGYVAADW